MVAVSDLQSCFLKGFFPPSHDWSQDYQAHLEAFLLGTAGRVGGGLPSQNTE